MNGNSILSFFGNPVLWPAVLSWFIAQFIKLLLGLRRNHRVDWRFMFSSGGMPSSHSAMVTALTATVGMLEGFSSMLFGVTAGFAIIVMYDAAGVRRAAGKQAATLNKLIEQINNHDPGDVSYETLKELIGHSPFQVFAGAVLGILIATLFNYII